MDLIKDASELARRLKLLAFGGKADAELTGKLQALPGVDAEWLTQGPELLYAYRDKLDDESLLLMGQLYQYAHDQGWTTFNKEGRSAALVGLVRRDLGEKGANVAKAKATWPDPDVRLRDGRDWREPEGD